MLNHITCELTASSNILDSLANGDRVFDFNLVVPMPEIVSSVGEVAAHVEDWARIVTGYLTVEWLFGPSADPFAAFQRGAYGAAANTFHRSNVQRLLTQGPYPKDFKDAEFDQLIAMMRALRSTGFANWYDWSLHHWGTKWNAYEAIRTKPNVLRFQTAWSAPLPVVAALSKLHPDESIFFRWADEDFGSNTGSIGLYGGEVASGDRVVDGSREAYDLAIELIYNGVIPDTMRRNADGSVDYLEDEDEGEIAVATCEGQGNADVIVGEPKEAV